MWSCVLVAALSMAGLACGKKGPPLAPFVRIPAAVQTIDARRLGDEVYVSLTVPAQNVDESAPADVRRVEVYGYTGFSPPARGRFLERAGMVAAFAVAPAGRPGEPPGEVVAGIAQGMTVTLRDALEADELTAPAPADASSTAAGGVLRRFYMAIAFSERGVPGPQGSVTELPLVMPPDPPSAPSVTYTADALTLTWQPADGLVTFLLDRALPPEQPPPGIEGPGVPVPPAAAANEGPPLYNVYREIAPDPLALPPPAEATMPSDAVPVPANPKPLPALTFTEPLTLDGRERCYRVRAVRGVPPDTVESEASARACVTPIDVFAPAMPADLAAIASASEISLIWEPGLDADLAGYLVLRAEAGGDTLISLTPEPIQQAQFIDDTVMPGARYVYRVIAVDDRLPLPNASAPAIIEAVAR